MPPLGNTLPVHVRVPEPDPSNYSLWKLVLHRYTERIYDLRDELRELPYCPTVCNVLKWVWGQQGELTQAEYTRLFHVIIAFMDDGLEGHQVSSAHLRTLTECAQLQQAWPSDLNYHAAKHRAEFRLRWLRWHAGLEIGGQFPWAARVLADPPAPEPSQEA